MAPTASGVLERVEQLAARSAAVIPDRCRCTNAQPAPSYRSRRAKSLSIFPRATPALPLDGDLEWDRLEAEPPRPARYQRSPPGKRNVELCARSAGKCWARPGGAPSKKKGRGRKPDGRLWRLGRQGGPVKTFPRGGLVSILRVHSFMMDTAERLRPGASWLTLWSTRIGDPYRRERGEGGVVPLLGSLPGAAPRSGSP